ncbi:hypothetical protein A3D88_03325 [Candidatus Peribacteria bacterium RIFCSPHIGHO2_02_FULL_52_16]|nr:MAG: hypothetical protein A2706_04145 [Candidatus Peribacteria bacterium RIFCSPHIGHO2_01_FULL_51_35]OGJ61361.1 MAG: hypothetical protein A3D88_03325 [Candidatus Peribacteria bacterium RIFCSPHIGHO2_02_FULL_52_16]
MVKIVTHYKSDTEEKHVPGCIEVPSELNPKIASALANIGDNQRRRINGTFRITVVAVKPGALTEQEVDDDRAMTEKFSDANWIDVVKAEGSVWLVDADDLMKKDTDVLPKANAASTNKAEKGPRQLTEEERKRMSGKTEAPTSAAAAAEGLKGLFTRRR